MNKAQFIAFAEKCNEMAEKRGLKQRELTDEHIDFIWNCYAKYEQEEIDGDVLNDTITKTTLYSVMKEIAM